MKLAIALLITGVVWGADIPKHPRELKYPEARFEPPRAADYRHKLSNGAVAYMVEDHALPLVNITIYMRTGGYLEPEDKTGVADLTGRVMRTGGTKTKSPVEFDEEAAFLAAQLSTNVGDVDGRANLNCLKSNLDTCMALFFDMLRNPGFAEDRLKLAKAQTLQAIQRRNDSTAQIEQREWERLLRGSHFTTRPATKASLESITAADLAAFHARSFFPANFIFAVSGDIEPKDMVARLERSMYGWSNGQSLPAIPKPSHTPKPGVFIVDKEGVNQGRVRIGHIGIELSNPDHLAVQMMNTILGGGDFTSRIMSRVRSDEGLAYSAGSVHQPGIYYPGTFRAAFQSKSPSVAQAIAIVLEEIDRIRKEKVSPAELKDEVTRASEILSRRFSTAQMKAGQFALDELERRPADYWAKYRARLQALTTDDILNAAQKYLHPDQLVILAVGDAGTILKGNPDRPEFQMSKFGAIQRIPLPDPLTMVYPGATQ